ncbi:hypothetical protein [Bordetella sp. BOR01]|uniref:hypothetical protein n=1 Tax=Bordetella sp. BOR01 TaxID=2854779 RepID=UPI001C48FB3B|nr:hypothetical protein [Bordetella sp. BOR01]MBV7485833.1 hypothetical protein [Bordetella sp. BOR01]
MARINIQQGELAHWLQFVADGDPAGVPRDQVPAHVADSLLILRCVRESEQQRLVLTDKGHLALRMEAPGAIHLG